MRTPSHTATGRSAEWQRANRRAHGLGAVLGKDHAALSDYACEKFDASSMSELSVIQMRQLCKALEADGAVYKKPRKKRLPNGQRRRFRQDAPDALPTPEQQRFILGLFDDLDKLRSQAGMAQVNRAKYVQAVLKSQKRAWPQSRSEAQDVIEGLKGWIGSVRERQSSR